MTPLLLQVSNSDQAERFAWVLLALILGGIVGLEREYRGHEAGIRTSALVCAGAAIFSQVSDTLGDARVAAGVVQGIGFLGAGLMFQRGDSVKGVTTAATIWVMAAVGILIGETLWLMATLITAAVVVLLELAPLSDWVIAHGRPNRARSSTSSARPSAEDRADPAG